MELEIIARMENDFTQKFGIPRQSGIAREIESKIIFEPHYRDPAALRGLEDFSHIWLLWGFSGERTKYSPTVRPPRLGGNRRMGVFATRSPNRPNNIGLSCVEISAIDLATPRGPVITVLGADLQNNTPIFDIKPYLPYADSIESAKGGFAADPPQPRLTVEIAGPMQNIIPAEKRQGLIKILSLDPRPQYQNDSDRIYKMAYSAFDIAFRVDGQRLTVVDIKPKEPAD